MPQTSDNIVSEVIDNGEFSAQQYVVVALCLLFNMLDGFDITAMAVVASSVSNDLNLTTEKIGWIFSIALLGMMLGAMFIAPLADLIGRRKMIIATVLAISVSVLLTAMASTLTEFVILRFISGLAAGGMLASQAALTAEYSPEKYRALCISIVVGGYPLGAMFTSVVAEYVMPEFGWRGMFWFGGTTTLLMVVVAVAFIPESLKFLLDRRPTNALERANKILQRLNKSPLTALPEVAHASPVEQAGFRDSLLKLVREPHKRTTFVLWSTFFLCFCTLYFLMSWVPKLMEHAGFSAQVGRQAFLVFNLGGVTGVILLGLLSTRWSLSRIISLFLLSSAALMVVFAFMPGQKMALLIIIALIGVLMQGGFTGLYAAAAKAYPTEIRSTGIGWGIGLGRIGAVAGPAIAGYLIAAGLSTANNFLLFAIPLGLSGIFAYYLRIH